MLKMKVAEEVKARLVTDVKSLGGNTRCHIEERVVFLSAWRVQ